IAAIGVTVRTPQLRDSASGRRPHRKTSTLIGPRRPTRRQQITVIITSQPPRDWTPRELARMLNVHPRHLATQLREWSLLGFFTRTPGWAPTGSTRHQRAHPRQSRQTLKSLSRNKAVVLVFL